MKRLLDVKLVGSVDLSLPCSFHQVLYVTVIFPYLGLIFLIIKSATKKGAVLGIQFFLLGNTWWESFLNTEVKFLY